MDGTTVIMLVICGAISALLVASVAPINEQLRSRFISAGFIACIVLAVVGFAYFELQ